MAHPHGFTRRDFLKMSGMGLAGATLASCNLRSTALQVTAVPPPLGSAPPPAPPLASGEVADLVVYNGNIATMDAARSKAKALAIKGGIIRLVGDERDVRAVAGDATALIDLRGRTVTPGLIDAHCHLSMCGLLGTAYVDINWPAVSTLQEVQARVSERIAVTPRGEWVVGSGWVSFDGRYPNKHDIDPYSPNHPVMLINQGGHMAVVNSLALEMAGVNAATKDPVNGRIEREANGQPSGILMNHPALDIFRKLWPPDMFDLAAMEASVLSPQAKFASMGVTSFQDVYARDMDRVQAYFNIAKRDQMSIRGQIMNVLEYIQELDGRIGNLEAMKFENDYMRLAGGKVQLDGVLDLSFTNEPHNGISWNVSIWKPDDLEQVVRAFHDAGYQMAFHAIGDAAVDMALNAIEAAMNANPRPDPRHRIEHAILNSNAALQRTKDLGVVISTQPQAIRMFADALEGIWGPERTGRIVPTRTWLDMGIPLSLSSDAPSMPWWDPQTTLLASILRLSATNKLISPDQALTIDEAIYAHTMGGAYADFAESKKGSLESGKFADLIVWHDDPFSVSTKNIVDLTVDLTMVGGKIVHQI